MYFIQCHNMLNVCQYYTTHKVSYCILIIIAIATMRPIHIPVPIRFEKFAAVVPTASALLVTTTVSCANM